MKCKAPWCDNDAAPLPFDGYCSRDHRDELEMEAEGYREEMAKLRGQKELLIGAIQDHYEGYREEMAKLRGQKELLIGAIQDHYDMWQTDNERLKLAQNKRLWRAIGIPEDDIDNVPG